MTALFVFLEYMTGAKIPTCYNLSREYIMSIIRSYVVRTLFRVIVLQGFLLFTSMMLLGCSPLRTNEDVAEISPTASLSKAVYSIGQEVDFGGITVKVNAVDDGYQDKNIVYDSATQKLVALQLLFSVSNAPITDPFDCNPISMELVTSSRKKIAPLASQGKVPYLSAQAVQKDTKAEGWVTFILDKNDEVLQLLYKPTFYRDDMRVLIGLSKNPTQQ